MSLELQMLGYSALLGFAQIILASHTASFQRGYSWTAGSRAETVAPLTGAAHRFAQALANFLETFPLFAALVLAAHVTSREGTLTFWGVQLYFWARLAYVPLYGVRVVRSLVWNVAAAGIILVAVALLWPGSL
ncbi:MAG: MAPEG family protein [Woeseiaceae bacterium]